MGCWLKKTTLTTVALGLGLAVGCRSDSKGSNYRAAGSSSNKELAVGTPRQSAADATVVQSNGAGPFRLLINLVNVRQRVPSQFLLLSKPQLVRLAAEADKVKDYNFKQGVKVSLKFKRPESDSVELALLVFDHATNKVSYLKSGEQVEFRSDGESVIADFVTFQSIFTVALAQVVAPPPPETRFVEPPADERPGNYDDFIKPQEKIYQETIQQSDAIADAPMMPQTDTSTSTVEDTETNTATQTTTATLTATMTTTQTQTTTATLTTTMTQTTTTTTTQTNTATMTSTQLNQSGNESEGMNTNTNTATMTSTQLNQSGNESETTQTNTSTMTQLNQTSIESF